MKKFTSSLLVVILLCGLVSSVSSAQSVDRPASSVPEGYTIVKIYDSPDSLSTQSLSKLGLSQVNIEPKITSNNSDEKVTVETLKNETKPVYDLKNIKTGEIVTQYKTEMAVIASSSGTYSANGNDPNYNVVGYGTMYYIFSDNSQFVHLDKADWRYTVSDSSVSLSNITHKFQQSGASQRTGVPVDQRKTLYPTTLSGTNLVRDWGWDAVDILGGLYKYGFEMNATVNRNGSKWNVLVLCYAAPNL